MFCNQCGREIRGDSIFCSYCGERTEEDPDIRQETDGAHGDTPCVRPGAPKKHCAECGKELPSSAISDVCAMCTIRRRNREIGEERGRRDGQGQNLDRYDISDEFDQSVFERGRSGGRRGEEAGSHSTAPVHNPRPDPAKDTGPEQKAPSGRGCMTAAVIAVVMLGLLGLIFFLSMARGTSVTPETYMDTEIRQGLDEAYPEDYSPYYGAPYQWYDTQAGELTSPQPLSVQTDSRGELLALFIAPAVESEMCDYYMFGSLIFNFDDALLSSDGIFITVGGTADVVSGNRKKTSPFSVTLIMSENRYETLTAKLGDETFFDILEYVDSDGRITSAGETYFERPAGETVFGEEEPLRLENFH